MPAKPATIAAEAAILACYRTMLGREPDQAGLAAYRQRLADGRMSFEDVLTSFLNSDEMRNRAAQFVGSTATPATGPLARDHSQFGEVGILLKHWVASATNHQLVVDAGARGRDRSNSYDLLRDFGWRGLLIEANPALIKSIELEFAGLNFELLNCAVSDYDGTATFHIGANDDVSSLNPEASLGWGAIQGTVAVAVRRLAPALQAHAIPHDFDLLSLDIEGEDIKVLNDLICHSAYRPTWIIIEASHDFRTKSLNDLDIDQAVKASYTIAAQTKANLMLKKTN